MLGLSGSSVCLAHGAALPGTHEAVGGARLCQERMLRVGGRCLLALGLGALWSSMKSVGHSLDALEREGMG